MLAAYTRQKSIGDAGSYPWKPGTQDETDLEECADMAEADLTQAGGLTGWVASVIESLGEVGVGLLVALENLVPPIPSEIVLSLAGYLASEGRMNVVLVWIAATAGSVLGALALYWLGYAVGEDRLKRWLDRLPLVDTDDLNKADKWFERHAKGAVLVGRCAPVVRSLISIPAGANHMNLGLFTLLTAIGSGVWNVIFVGGGYALGSNFEQLGQYSNWFNYAMYAFFAIAIGSWVTKKVRKRRAAAGRSR
jgi:membrane protein DedA with SNARE-associated domain